MLHSLINNANHVGLFGAAENATIQNISITNASVTSSAGGTFGAGVLGGYVFGATAINNIYVL